MSTEVIANEAARWWLLAHEGERDEAAFAQWLQADPRNARQYQHLQHLWEAGSGLPSVQRAHQQRRRRRQVLAGATLSAVIALVMGSITAPPAPAGQELQTRTGEIRRIALDDGSQVLLAGDTHLHADITSAQRQVVMDRGQAWFKVAADAQHPFTVNTPHGSVTALGTAFDIRISEMASVVTVTEHRVRVHAEGIAQIAGEGQQLRFDGRHAGALLPADAAATAWQQQRVLQVMQPLAEVTAELDRWHGGRTLVLGSALRAQRVSVMGSTNAAGASRDQLARQLPVRVLRLGAGLQVWLPGRQPSP